MEFGDERKELAINEDDAKPTNEPRPFDPLFFKVTGITDRDAPSLYVCGGDRDLYRLWADKVDMEDSSPNADLDLFEMEAFKAFQARINEETPVELRYCFAQNTSMPFIRAILDGACFSGEKKVIARIVTQDREAFERVSALHLPTRAGRVPERNWVELQHQMIVSGLESAYFVSTIDGNQVAAVEVKYDPVFGSNHVAECVLFWDHVRRGVPPKNAVVPADVDPDSDEAQAAEPNQLALTPPEDQL